MSHEGFTKGDLVEVTTREQWKGTFRDFGTIRGTAMDTRGRSGEARFRLWINSPGLQAELSVDLNYVDVKTLFVAMVARGEV